MIIITTILTIIAMFIITKVLTRSVINKNQAPVSIFPNTILSYQWNQYKFHTIEIRRQHAIFPNSILSMLNEVTPWSPSKWGKTNGCKGGWKKTAAWFLLQYNPINAIYCDTMFFCSTLLILMLMLTCWNLRFSPKEPYSQCNTLPQPCSMME